MNPFSLGLLFSVATTFLLAVIVLILRFRSLIHRTFSIYLISIGFWAAFSAVQTLSSNPATVSWAVIVMHWGAIFISVFFLHFLYYLTRKIPKWLLATCYLISFGFLLLNTFTSLFVSGIVPKKPFHYFMKAGPLYPPYILFFLFTWSYAVLHLYREFRSEKGAKRKQLQLLFIGSLIGYAGGSGAFLPVYDLSLPFFYPYGNFAIAVYVSIMTYAIVRHRFLDIEIIIRRTVVFAGLLAFVFAVFSAAAFFVREVLAKFGLSPIWTYAISLFLIVLGYDPIRNNLINLTDRYLFQKKYDYQKILKDASRGMSKIEDLKHLLGLVVHFVTMRMRVKNAVVLLHQETAGFKIGFQRGYGKTLLNYRLDITSPLIIYLMHEKEAFDRERIREYSESGKHHSYDFDAILRAMQEMEAECVVPSFLGHELRNILILGEKKSGNFYSVEDLNVLFTLAQESAIAIENARLYDEAIQRTQMLANMNKELEDTNEKLKVTQTSLIVAEKNATMVGMAKAIGHEINNPLSSVILPIERIHRTQVPKCRDAFEKILAHMPQEQREQTKESQEIINKVLTDIQNATIRADRSANRISAVVHTLTDILKDSKGEMGSLSFLVLCREAVDASRFSTSGLVGREIKQNIQPNLMIRGNVNQLLQVFVNLVKNAFEAMDNQKDRSIIINADYDPNNPEMALIEFIDNGPGIPPEALPKIWMQGFSTKEKKDDSIGAAGQGQGLFVCKHVIESIHKGSITAESTPGKGTKFIIRLPLAELKENA